MTNLGSINAPPKEGYPGLYRTIWRWHFYAGLFCIPFVITLALSGMIYLFKPQIDAFVDRGYHNLPATAPRATAQSQIDAALAALPNSRLVSYRLPETAHQAVVITLLQGDTRQLVYMNPYTREILTVRDFDNLFVNLVKSFHGELLLGNAGAVVIELAGCWAIVLLLTGLYLWWPGTARGLAGVLYPRLRQGGRQFWRDLHAVCGIWVAALALFLLVSGLPWALVWGSAFKEIRAQFEPATSMDWVLSSAHEGHAMAAVGQAEDRQLAPSVYAAAQALQFAPPVELSPDTGNPHLWKVSSQHANRMLRADAWLDRHSAEVVKLETFAQRRSLDKAVGIGISAHEGQLFGWANQLLGLITASGLILLCVSGAVMWYRRRPVGKFGAPPATVQRRLTAPVIATMLGLALFLPLLALSIAVIGLMEALVLKRLRTG